MLTKVKGTIKQNLLLKGLSGRSILIEDIGKKVLLHNGKELFQLVIVENMVGYFFSDFRFTKVTGSGIHVKKKKKKKVKNNTNKYGSFN